MSAARESPLADAYERYARLITSQIDALDRGDLDTLETLASQRDQLAGEIDALRGLTQAGGGAEDALPHVQSCLRADLRLRRRLEALQADLLRTAGRIDRDRAAVRVYGAAGSVGGNVDFSF